MTKFILAALVLLAPLTLHAAGIADVSAPPVLGGSSSHPALLARASAVAVASNVTAETGSRTTASVSPAPALRGEATVATQSTNDPHSEPGDDIATPSVRFTYTPSGMRDSITDGNGVTLFNYDSQDRLTGVEFPHGEAVSYSYDKAGNLTELLTAYQRIVYTYDARHRLETVTDATGTTRFSYDQVGNRTGLQRPNGVHTVYSYGPRHRLESIAHYTSSNALIFSVTYTLDASGLRLTAVERDSFGILRSIAYSYDELKRLVAETIVSRDPMQSRKLEWTYDKVGNRLTQTLTIDGLSATTEYTYDSNDRLLTERLGGQLVSYTYDANGNTQSRTSSSGRVEYDYDRANRLVEMRDGTQRIRYGYDADGMRLSQTRFPASGEPVTTYYLLDKSQTFTQVIEEHERIGSGSRRLSAIYTFGNGPLAQTRGEQQSFILADGMGSTRLVTDAGGNVTDTLAFDAFGNELTRTGSTELAHLYRGEQFDPNLGFYNLRARYYDPKSGRFTSMDTFAGFGMDPPSLHKYTYAASDPVNGMDPSGHFTLKEVGTALSVAATLATIYSTVHTIGEFASGERELSAKEIGIAALWVYAGSKLGPVGGRIMQGLRRAGCLSNSFTGDTLVETADGLKPIREIKVGDLVLSRNMDTGENELQSVSDLMSTTKRAELIVVTLDGGTRIEATPEHVIFADGDWAQVRELVPGAKLIGSEGNLLRIERVESVTRDVTVFDLTVAKNRNFFVSKARALVHNITKCERAAQAIAKLASKSCQGVRGKCVDYAEDLEKKLLEKEIKGKRLCVRSAGGIGAPYSDAVGSLGDNSYHYAVQVGELVFDNMRPDGIPISEWVKDLGGAQYVGGAGSGAPLELVEQEMGSPFDCARR